MSEKCGTCGQYLPATGDKPKSTENIEIRALDKFSDLCRTLAMMPSLASEPQMIGFLTDVPDKLRRYHSLTAGQGRFFKAIHFKATGTWPPDWSAFQKEDVAPVWLLTPSEEDSIPF